MNSQNKKAQTWSFDLVVAVIIFIVVVAAFYAFLHNNSSHGDAPEVLQSKAKVFNNQLNCEGGSASACIVNDGVLSQDSLNKLNSLSYTEYKEKMGMTDDFCFYIVDKNGYIIPINGYWGYGDPTFELSKGIFCNQSVS